MISDQIMQQRSRVWVIVLVFLIGIASSTSLGYLQTEKTERLALRITLARSSVCLGSRFLDVETELRNVSRDSIAISLAGLGASGSVVSVPRSLDEDHKAKLWNSDPFPTSQPGTPLQKIVLDGEQSSRRTFQLPMDKDFFTPGIYRLTIGFSGFFDEPIKSDKQTGWTRSNDVLFEVEKCATAVQTDRD